MNKKLCVVFLCDIKYLDKFIQTHSQLITNGNYKGDVCLVTTDDIKNNKIIVNNEDYCKKHNIIVKYFSNIKFDDKFIEIQRNLDRWSIWFDKRIQFHKLHLFNRYFKQWDYIFYIDCGITIFSDITPILNEIKEYKLLAHSDAYPKYEWKLSCQFDQSKINYYSDLNNNFNLNIDYFQTTIMLYDTKIIEEDTYDNMLQLLLKYPISKTNDQGIISLYFTNIKPCFEQMRIKNDETYFYDYLTRSENNKYIMLKDLRVLN